ncbi:PPOX class F420-dependent oxidoreductase [Bailinhaonella thermotolerans]|uniref:PPOX class F420-dependent oxidoreductase n=1 Tax=Bailinhaonella thermotolerans TaxID=1070861 RepID=A0A3A4AMC5_9ACTN|nr:PPOX class F420-dependent oxidoreductase [Bailinhaonella thermotolerans]RJL30816.1 PPOX class F420-dependent oxidoreductase [Bailinhaonella thermotolerans]
MALPAEARALLTAPNFAFVATLQPDGSPQTSIVWVKSDEEAVYFSTLKDRRKYANLARDPRVSLIVQDPEDPQRYVEVRGRAALSDDPERTLIEELALAYTGKPFRQEAPDKVRVIVRVVPEKVVHYAGPGQVRHLS